MIDAMARPMTPVDGSTDVPPSEDVEACVNACFASASDESVEKVYALNTCAESYCSPFEWWAPCASVKCYEQFNSCLADSGYETIPPPGDAGLGGVCSYDVMCSADLICVAETEEAIDGLCFAICGSDSAACGLHL